MMDLFCEGLEDSKTQLEGTLTSVLQLPMNDMQMQAVDGGGTPIPITINIGEEKLDTILLNAQSRYNLMSGGR